MLGMLWFGLGSAMVVAIVALMVAPAIHVAVIEGLSAVDAALAEMARAYRVPPGMRLWHIYAPAMAAPLFSGGVVALGMAMRVAVMAETLGSNEGVGHALAVARTNLDTPQLYALALLTMLLVGLAEMTLLGLARRAVGRRRA
jgi:NitT/TauT family transport system permease protein